MSVRPVQPTLVAAVLEQLTMQACSLFVRRQSELNDGGSVVDSLLTGALGLRLRRQNGGHDEEGALGEEHDD